MSEKTVKIEVNDSYLGTFLFSGAEALRNLTDKIIDELPADKKAGNLVMETSDIWLYLSVTWLSVCFFFFAHFGSQVLLKKFNVRAYTEKDIYKRDEYVNCITSSLEKLVLTVFAVFNTITIQSPEGEYFGWFKSNVTLFEVQRNYGLIMAFSVGYLLFDEMAIAFLWNDNKRNKMTFQMRLHHYIVGLYFFCSASTGYMLASTNSVGLVCEFSTLLLNTIEMMTMKEGCVFMSLQVGFLVVYTVMRIFFFPYVWLLNVSFIIGMWPHLSVFRRITAITGTIMGVALIVLMYYWYYFVVRKLLRVLGCTKGRETKEDSVEPAANNTDDEDNYALQKKSEVEEELNQETDT